MLSFKILIAKIFLLAVLITELVSCAGPYRNYEFADVDIKMVKTSNHTFRQRYGNSLDTNCCLALMGFDINYINRDVGIFSSGVEPGREGVENKIKSICIYDCYNQNINDQILGFNFKEQDFRIDKNPLLDHSKYNSLNLQSYNNLNDFKESVNLNKHYSSGTDIQSLILLSVPDIITKSPIYFKMYFENKDSLVKKIDLSKDSIDTIQIY